MSAELPFEFVDEGERDQLPVVFLHAFPYHGGMWQEQRDALRGRARFLSFDARGVGPVTRSRAPTAYMLEQLVDDLFALLDQRGIDRCVLCGLSMGGYVALRALQREPARVRGLLLADSQAGADGDEAKLGRAQGLRMLARDGQAAFAQAQLQRQLSPHTLATQPELVARLRQLIMDSSPESVAASMVALATRTELQSVLPQLRVPTTLVVGADDKITTPAIMQNMSEQIPGASLHVLERAGHLSNLEAAPRFNQLLLALVERVAAT